MNHVESKHVHIVKKNLPKHSCTEKTSAEKSQKLAAIELGDLYLCLLLFSALIKLKMQKESDNYGGHLRIVDTLINVQRN